MKQLSLFFSTIFSPLLIPIFSSLIILWANPYAFGGSKSATAIMFLYYITVCTFIMPAVGIFMLKRLNLVDDMNLKQREQRIVPYFIIIVCYSIAFYLLNNLEIPPIVRAMIFGSLGSIIISFFVNNFMKISAHANGMGSLVGVILGLLLLSNRSIEFLLFLALLCTGAVLSSRLYLKAHSLKEVSWGFLLGLFSQLIAFYIFYRFA